MDLTPVYIMTVPKHRECFASVSAICMAGNTTKALRETRLWFASQPAYELRFLEGLVWEDRRRI